jgi:lipid-binding SYLF domain-containing protein
MTLFGADEAIERIDTAAQVFHEINSAPDKGIPQDLIERAKCVAIIPGVKKGGFVVGAQYGKGVMTCRTGGRSWSGPSTIRLEGGSIGAQIGAGESDVILVVLNDRGAQRLMDSKFTIGGEGAVMAGPVGRDASAKTDALMTAEILSYARSRGAFAGITLNGSTLRPDNDDNAKIYGKAVDHKDILTGKVSRPASASALYSALGGLPNDHTPADTRSRSKQK